MREMILNPLGLAFHAGDKLASMSNPRGRDVFVGNNQVLEGIRP